MNVVLLYFLLLKALVLSFSGFASVPLVREDLVVKRHALSDERLNDAIAIGQVSPGPLGVYTVVVGYFVAGIPGAAAGSLALATPALLAIPIAFAVQRGRDTNIRGACSGVVIGACVLMFTAAINLAPEAASTWTLVTIAGVAVIVLAMSRLPPMIVVLLSAAAGTLLT